MELKLCPFCGSEAYIESTITEETIRCTLCPAKMNYDGSQTAIIAMWNNRTLQPKDSADKCPCGAPAVLHGWCKDCFEYASEEGR